MIITVGIITHNRSETISRCLKSLALQTRPPDEIVVVDTSDDNKTELLINKIKMPVKYTRPKNRIRQPAARNMILKNSKGDIIAFLDDDTVPKKFWLENVEKSFGHDKNIAGACGPAIDCDKNLNPTHKMLRTDRNQNFFTSCGDVREKTRLWVPPRPVKCSVMLGANMAFRTDKLKEVGGFVDFYTGGYGFREENFPQVALIKKGYTFLYNPKVFVWHIKKRAGGAEKDFEHYYLCGKYHRYFADKFFPKWKSRLSWIFWSFSPPCLWICIILSVIRRDKSILRWQKGLWGF
ncbi:MAG: glycosyltransferase family 2 protein [Candidatus Aenigmarchaeota archaeon]|nr:glycosyltransferase family 2 protein [Candidatus Aenigmarchaeota archaeon]